MQFRDKCGETARRRAAAPGLGIVRRADVHEVGAESGAADTGCDWRTYAHNAAR